MIDSRIRVIVKGSEEYPEKLLNIANPPRQLYCIGDVSLLRSRSIAVVGSRKFTIYGKQMAMLIGRTAARSGIPVISGLASGIDTFAHEGVLSENGKAIAVLGTGIGNVYPRKNESLYNRISDTGLIVSEYPPSFPGANYSFPARNRIISALSESLIVVEAGVRSGALITASFAAEQGKSVYAVPGNINSQFSLGTNLLIRDGAIPLVIVSDVLKDMNAETETDESVDEKHSLGEDEEAVMDCVRADSGTNVNSIAYELDKKPAQVNAILTILEIKGLVVTYGGKIHLAK